MYHMILGKKNKYSLKSDDIIHWREKPFAFPWFGFVKNG